MFFTHRYFILCRTCECIFSALNRVARKVRIFIKLLLMQSFLFLQISCLRALQEGDFDEFHRKLKDSKQVIFINI